MDQRQALINEAQQILRGAATRNDAGLVRLGKDLKDEKLFGLAWRILEKVDIATASRKDWLTAQQQRANCLTKDPDLPSDERLDRALAVLGAAEDLSAPTTSSETLGLAGAVYKRKWEDDAQRSNLEKALAYYRRGHRPPALTDDGYCGINAAFILDLLGSQELQAGGTELSSSADRRFAEAKQIRAEIIEVLQPRLAPKQAWWIHSTLAEAYLGMLMFDKVAETLATRPDVIREWELETFVRQMALLARIHSERLNDPGILTRAENALQQALALSEAAMRSAFTGKVGIALSGGGFRASLYHIGVLARLAELDVLRHVEVISGVSGGSILGAYYYLKLRKLLQEKRESEIVRADYIRIVDEMADEFLAGVQKNIRTRVAGSFWSNVRMIFSDEYSRTERAGELYEEYLYRQITKDDAPILMKDLLIRPKDDPEGDKFQPGAHNWRRDHKVPILILNATSLNTGHQWQFTARSMGEPPLRKADSIDAVYRLRRMNYEEAPQQHQNVRLGVAVGASAAVPALFEPIAFKNLYPLEANPPKVVRLCDGGVHDNQGVAALLEQSCKVIFVSDASGQMAAEDNPKSGPVGVLLRADSILQARLREAQYRDFAARRRSGLLQGSMFIHLTKELAADPVNWVGCTSPKREVPPPPLTTYGVDRKIQQQLAEVRTDLDSFSDAEAYALMTSGYLMARQCATQENFPTLPPLVPSSHPWGFLGVRDAMDGTDRNGQEKLTGLLDESKKLAFKVWSQVPALKYAGYTLLLLAVCGGAWAMWKLREVPLLTVGAVGMALLMVILGMFGLQWVKYLDVRRMLQRVAVGLGLSTVGWLAARIHLHLFDPLFLKVGQWEKVQAPAPATGIATGGPTLPPIGPPAATGTAETIVPAEQPETEPRADDERA